MKKQVNIKSIKYEISFIGFPRQNYFNLFPEALLALTGRFSNKKGIFSKKECTSERLNLIEQLLIDAFEQFKLKVYFNKKYIGYERQTAPLDSPECVTKDTLQ